MSEDRYELSEGWVWTKIGNLSSVITKGSTPTSYGFAYQDKGILFVKVENISNYSIKRETISQYISRETHQFLKRSQLQENDMLFSIAGTIGRVCLIKKEDLPANTNQALAIIRIPNSNIHKKYLLYYLDSRIVRKFVRSEMRGVGIYNISLENAKDIDVPLPPLSEQKRIVEKIESLFDRLNKTKQSLAKIPPLLKKFRQSVLAKAFSGELTEDWRTKQKDLEPTSALLARIRTERKNLLGKKYKEPEPIDISDLSELPEGWEWATLESIGEIVTGNTPFTENKRFYGDFLPFVKPGDLDQGKDIVAAKNFLSKDGAKQARILPSKSIMVTSIGATIGKTGISAVECATNQQINSIVPSSGIEAYYVYYYCLSQFFFNQMLTNSSSTTLPIINKGRFSALPIPIVSTRKQREIVRKIEGLFAQADTIEKSVKIAQAYCEKLTPSIIAKAFRGELVDQDPNDEPAGGYKKSDR